ncbi:MAG: hypothetical protein E6Q35_02295 [Chryseobacterium cucumeris]|nr:MAG: hypothetical protein E6Q35_02295 [Chryseobacterium cucumeris]
MNKRKQKETKQEKERKYPDISVSQEKAVILRAQGKRFTEIAQEIGKSEQTVRIWFIESPVKKALELENLEIVSEMRDAYGSLIKSSFAKLKNVIEREFQDEKSEISAGNLALGFLKETGFIPKSASEERKQAIIRELVQRLESSIAE